MEQGSGKRVPCRNPLCDVTLPVGCGQRYCRRCRNMGHKVPTKRALKPEDIYLLAMLDAPPPRPLIQ